MAVRHQGVTMILQASFESDTENITYVNKTQIRLGAALPELPKDHGTPQGCRSPTPVPDTKTHQEGAQNGHVVYSSPKEGPRKFFVPAVKVT